MDLETVFRTGSFRSLVSAVLTNRALRNGGLRFAERKIQDMLVHQNVDSRPTQVQQDKSDYLVAMLHSAWRNIERGLISKHVRDRLLDVFLGNVICSSEAWSRATERLGFTPPFFVTVSPGERCNLRCTGCYASSNARCAVKLDWHLSTRETSPAAEQTVDMTGTGRGC